MDKELLRKLQLTELDILKQIHDFCITNSIQYSLYAGTAIGAVRHGGFIPWDDDIDVVMTRNDYLKFIKCWNQTPINGYFMENTDTNENCTINHTKIRKDDTVFVSEGEQEKSGHQGVWVDIFVFDKVKDKPLSKLYISWNCVKRVLYSRGNYINSSDSTLKKFIKKLLSLIPLKYRTRKIGEANLNIQKYKDLETNYHWMSLSTIKALKYVYKKDVALEYQLIKFEDIYCMIFKDYDTALRVQFGDYMQLPPEEKRVCMHNPVQIKL